MKKFYHMRRPMPERPQLARFTRSKRCDTLMRMIALRLAALSLILLVLAGCGLLPRGGEDETKDWSASKLYSEARSALNSGDYETSIKYYQTLEARYPFGRHAQQGLLDVGYAYYKFEEPDSAVAAADRFIKTYPLHPNIDYAYYLKGLVNFNRGMGLLERYVPVDASERDPAAARQSFDDFAELVRRFPNSKYSEDARQRMTYLVNNLAQHEIHVADFYMRRGAYLAAANRAKYVVEHYPSTPAAPEALRIMADAYDRLGLPDLARDARRVLELNQPGQTAKAESKWMFWR
jgi:outer membrane protein assembly factor BamD